MIICDFVDEKLAKRHKDNKQYVLTYIDQKLKYYQNQISLNHIMDSSMYIDFFDQDEYLDLVKNFLKISFIESFEFGEKLYNSIDYSLNMYKSKLNILRFTEKNSKSDRVYFYNKDLALFQLIKSKGFKAVKKWKSDPIKQRFKNLMVIFVSKLYVNFMRLFSDRIDYITSAQSNKYFVYLFGRETNSKRFLNRINEVNYFIPSIDEIRIRYMLKRLKKVNVLKLNQYKSNRMYKLFLKLTNEAFRKYIGNNLNLPPLISKREFNLIYSYWKNLKKIDKTKGLLVSQNYLGHERFLVESTCRELTKAEINHGFPSQSIPPKFNQQYDYITSIFIYGEGDEKVYLKRFEDIKSPNLIKIGNPIFDNFITYKKKNDELYLLLILQTSDGSLDIVGPSLEYFLKAIHIFKIKGIIKFHQRQTFSEVNYVNQRVKQYGCSELVVTGYNLNHADLFSKKLIILSPDSTYSIELLFTRNIIIYLDIFRRNRTIHLDKFNFALSINEIEGLISKLDYIVDNFDIALCDRLVNWDKTVKYFTNFDKNISFSDMFVEELKKF